MNDEEINTILQGLDVSDIENIEEDDDNDETFLSPLVNSSRQIGNNIFDLGNLSDDTDSDPDYVPDSDSDDDKPHHSTSTGAKVCKD